MGNKENNPVPYPKLSTGLGKKRSYDKRKSKWDFSRVGDCTLVQCRRGENENKGLSEDKEKPNKFKISRVNLFGTNIPK